VEGLSFTAKYAYGPTPNAQRLERPAVITQSVTLWLPLWFTIEPFDSLREWDI